MTLLGCQEMHEHFTNRWVTSKCIYEYLARQLGDERAIFHKDFDIPLWIIAEDRDLQINFFSETLPEEDERNDEEIL